jgi:glutathione transport system permease protein
LLKAVSARLVLSIPVLAGAILFGFVLLRVVPGDPAALLAGQSASAQVVSQLRIEMGLDKPWILQLFHYFGDVVVGNLGRSIISNRPVLEELIEAFGPTAELVLASDWASLPPCSAARSSTGPSWLWRSLASPCRSSGSATC